MAKYSRVFVVEGNPDDVFLACQRTVNHMGLAVKSMTGHAMVLRKTMTMAQAPITLDVTIRGLREGSSNLEMDGVVVMAMPSPWIRRAVEETMAKFAMGSASNSNKPIVGLRAVHPNRLQQNQSSPLPIS